VILGLVVERLLMRPLYSGYASWGVMRDEYAVIITFGLSLLLINLVDKIVGPYAYKGPALVGITRMVLGPFSSAAIGWLPPSSPSGSSSRPRWSCAIPIGAGKSRRWRRERLQGLARRHRHGESERHRLRARGRTCCYFGCTAGQHLQSDTGRGRVSAIKSYVIVVLGGMGSLPGSIVASLILGVLEASAAFTSPINIATPSVW
jgi:branched-chain amino acid transport system permease protein